MAFGYLNLITPPPADYTPSPGGSHTRAPMHEPRQAAGAASPAAVGES